MTEYAIRGKYCVRVIVDDKSMFMIRLMMKLKFVILNADGRKMKYPHGGYQEDTSLQ